MGGDEFIILLDEIENIDGVMVVANKVLDALSQPMRRGEQELVCGGSIGASRYPANGETAIELIAAADQAMYRAKTGGRRRVCMAGEGEEGGDLLETVS
jgi:diguanylate cyclase (GGDEF)-like protein